MSLVKRMRGFQLEECMKWEKFELLSGTRSLEGGVIA